MSAPEKPCGKCIHYRRSKKGLKLKSNTNQIAIPGIKMPEHKPPRWYGACVKNKWYVSANMGALEDCGWETAFDLSMQWNGVGQVREKHGHLGLELRIGQKNEND